MRQTMGLVCVWFMISVSVAGSADWPGWRGPTGMGQTEEKTLPLRWGGTDAQNVLWKSPLPSKDGASQDQNQSSPVVSRGRVFVTVSFWPGKTDPKQFPEHHVACYRVSDGNLQIGRVHV